MIKQSRLLPRDLTKFLMALYMPILVVALTSCQGSQQPEAIKEGRAGQDKKGEEVKELNTSKELEKQLQKRIPDYALLILESTDTHSMQQAKNYIEDRGGRITHIYPTHILIGSLPKSISKELIGKAGIKEIHYGIVDPSSVEEYGKTAVYAVQAWNNNVMGLAVQKGLTPEPGVPELGPIIGDTLIPPETEKPVRRDSGDKGK